MAKAFKQSFNPEKVMDEGTLIGIQDRVIEQVIAWYRERILGKGYDIGRPGEYKIKDYLEGKVKIEIKASISVWFDEIDRLIKKSIQPTLAD